MTRGIAINGFGRIGRLAFRLIEADSRFKIAAINDLTDAATLAHLLKYDSNHGSYKLGEITSEEGAIIVSGVRIPVLAEREPEKLPWGELGVDTVIECSGRFTDKAGAERHIQAGAKRVLISAPAKGGVKTVVFNVNEGILDGTETVISGASCTTNCLAPVAKVLNDKFGIVKGLMTTVHAATATQKTVDGPSMKDWRGGRGILENIIPSSTGAAKAVGKVIPELNKKLTGMSFRVPTSDVSVVDLTVVLAKETTYDAIKAAMKEASEGELKGILGYTEEKVVSTDFRGEAKTSIFDAEAGIMLDSTFAKIVSWYDNEWGYSNKVLEMVRVIAK
jgi:glyceraldehyde 3-phosphate dehydrogenase